MEIIRTRFGRDIVAEVALPTRRRKRGDKVIIFCAGMPGTSSKTHFLRFLSGKGYVVVYPRYRGAWESRGVFLEKSPEDDIKFVIGKFNQPFKDLWTGQNIQLTPSEIYIIASSFGGPAGILLTKDKRVRKVVALSPVVDWTAPSGDEPLEWMYEFTRDAFGAGYGLSKAHWNKLKRGDFYNPARRADEVVGNKLFIIHAKDDTTVLWRPVERFAKKVSCKLLMLKRGGHFGASEAMKPTMWKRVEKFLKG